MPEQGARMAVRDIVQLGDPRLREPATLVSDPTSPAVVSLVEDLRDTLAAARATTGYGRGIAAPQLGVAQRVIFLQLPGKSPWPLVNPEIIRESEQKIVVWDACLSFLCIFMQVERHRAVTVRYQDLRGEFQEAEADERDDLSELLQHEVDHLNGILCIDRVTELRTICTREEFEKRYRAQSPYASAGKANR
jgi:peptide deformylase